MNRREFIQSVAAGLAVAPLLASAAPVRIPTRTLGRTGIKVPIIGFGSGSRFLMYQKDEDAWEALNRAIDLGITYIDTAHAYGNGKSEERVGHVMATRRKEVVLATKIPGRTADQARRQIELSLKRLQTDHLDVLHIHDLKGDKDIEAIEARGGVLEALHEARDQKITRAIGITCHANPAGLKTMLERHDFDCTQMALNAGMARMADLPGGMKATLAGETSFERLALPVATRKHMGVIAMKVFGQEQLLRAASVENLLAYVLSLPISLASLGMPRLEHIDKNASLACTSKRMSGSQRRKLSDTIESEKKLAMMRFFEVHQDC
jgi:predicted aldo/keto reductase-like oxidoreductase